MIATCFGCRGPGDVRQLLVTILAMFGDLAYFVSVFGACCCEAPGRVTPDPVNLSHMIAATIVAPNVHPAVIAVGGVLRVMSVRILVSVALHVSTTSIVFATGVPVDSCVVKKCSTASIMTGRAVRIVVSVSVGLGLSRSVAATTASLNRPPLIGANANSVPSFESVCGELSGCALGRGRGSGHTGGSTVSVARAVRATVVEGCGEGLIEHALVMTSTMVGPPVSVVSLIPVPSCECVEL